MPRAFSSGAASIWSYGLYSPKILGDRRRQRRLAMVDVTNRANVHMRLRALEFTFCHVRSPFLLSPITGVELSYRRQAFGITRISSGLPGRPRSAPARSGRTASCTGRGPGDIERRLSTYLNMLASGTIALTTTATPRASWPWIWPRRRVQVADDVADIVLRRHHLDLHDRLEQLHAELRARLRGSRRGRRFRRPAPRSRRRGRRRRSASP